MLTSINYSLYRIANFYNSNQNQLGKTMLRLSSGKRFTTPNDDLASFVRSYTLGSRYTTYENLRPTLVEYQGVMNTAADAGNEVLDALTRMKELIDIYDAGTADEQAAYDEEYLQLAASVERTIETTTHAGKDLLNESGTLATLTISPDSDTMAITLGEAIDTGGGDISDYFTPGAGEDITDYADEVNGAITDVNQYLGKTAGYTAALESQVNIVDTAMTNLESARGAIENIDEAAEQITYTKQDIRQQAAAAMLAQGNLAHRNVLLLYGMSTS